MKRRKLSVMFLLTFVTACLLTGCTNFDASAYIKACLDANTHGEFQAYADITQTSVEEVEALYNSNIDSEVAYVEAYNISDEKKEAFRNLFIDIYKSFKYEVGEAVKNDDDSYSVPVTTYKLMVFKDVMTSAQDYITDYASQEVDAGRTPTQEQLEEVVLDYLYDGLKANLNKLEYAEAVSSTIKVSPTKSGSTTVYSASQTELQALLQSFIDLENAQ